MMSNEVNEWLKRYTQHVPLRQNTEEKVRGKELQEVWDDTNEWNWEVVWKTVWEERSKGIEIRISDVFVIIKPTTPFKLAKHEARRKWDLSDSLTMHYYYYLKPMLHVVVYFHQNEKKEKAEGRRCHAKTMMNTKADKSQSCSLVMCHFGKWSIQEGMHSVPLEPLSRNVSLFSGE